ncbi:ImmA/IrrE family metallo-endopeptidase [Archangium lansingense]|uniref:ImmA/IrrE family metallo-endopeptidase n=1 Tax=Archangium lansingense TaxID=2995310 RepID=A0ABT4A0D1_9BACT|nr:ImmA/IrrE family metallo-endopeptidase [Archangium lansinium]MCY1074749.1 ImmA/IrrE family metallo-endopeptidase [Archangium lansinium]
MTEGWLKEAVKACHLPPAPSLDELLKRVRVALQLLPKPQPHLTSDHVRDWLKSRGRAHGALPQQRRRLHGCMVAQAGKGVLFYDSEDDEAQQRFTLVHEVAHFVLDHLLLRERARRVLGNDILQVLDGQRAPSPHESLFSVLERISFGVQVRLMERNASGDPRTGRAMEAELNADRLAFELLAPAEEVVPLVRRFSKQEAEAELVSRFGLPPQEARCYVRLLLAREPVRRPFFLKSVSRQERSYGG